MHSSLIGGTSLRTRVIGGFMSLSLVGVSGAIWVSPDARDAATKVLGAGSGISVLQQDPAHRPAPAVDRRDAELARLRSQVDTMRKQLQVSPVTALDAPGEAASATDGRLVDGGRPDGGTTTGGATAGEAGSEQNGGSTAAGRGGPRTTKNGKKVPKCWDFRWQQDAQAAYAKDLSDPGGLDGAPGPNDDDGIACAELPVDPSRPRSTPVGANRVVPPKAPSLDALRNPERKFFGLYSDGAPFSWSKVNEVKTAVEKVPSMIGYFSAGDQQFRPDAVTSAWNRGMLPFLTWELRPRAFMGPGGAENLQPGYSLHEIASGSLDSYLKQYAAAVAALGLPMAIRLDHEMNGGWYPWSIYSSVNSTVGVAGYPDRTGAEWYQLMWRHVHDIFAAAGATNVLWVWSPNKLNPARSDFQNFYPGDDYVDWIGMSGYHRLKGDPATFASTFGPTLRKLRGAPDSKGIVAFPHAAKPILLSEIGASEVEGTKVAWINDLFASLKKPENADIVGFGWFHNTVTSTPTDPRDTTTNDWRITSSKTATAAFKAGVADPSFSSGTK
jgi:mannan endo-1,4-beta-mannosidase